MAKTSPEAYPNIHLIVFVANTIYIQMSDNAVSGDIDLIFFHTYIVNNH